MRLLNWALRLTEHFVRNERQFIRPLKQDIERGFKLKARFENGAAAKNVKTQTCAREGNGEATDIAEVADGAGTHEGEDDIYL
jgi:hypothetical protein